VEEEEIKKIESSESDEEKLTPEVNEKITSSIKVELTLLKEKVKVSVSEMKELREKIKESRLNGNDKNETLRLVSLLQEKKRALADLRALIRSSKTKVNPASESDE